MEWIAGWSKRIKLTIDHTKVKDNLVDFPILVNLDSTCSGIFNELGDNSKRISFINPSTHEQYFCEIERWDSLNQSAQLWVKLPTVASGIDTELYMLYDNTQDNNTTYIGETSSTPAENVWDSNFLAVYHMSADPTNSIVDSTGLNTATTVGVMSSSDVIKPAGSVLYGLDFNNSASGQGVETPFMGNTFVPAYSVEADVFKYATSTVSILDCQEQNVYWPSHYPKISSRVDNTIYYGAGTKETLLSTNAVSTSEYLYAAFTYSGSIATVFYDDILDTSTFDITPYSINNNYYISTMNAGDTSYKQVITEFRISKIVRTESWLKATKYSNADNLITKALEEIQPTIELDYQNKIQLIIPNDSIEDTLYNFPVLINLSSSSGFTNVDATDVFIKLGSTFNRKKIAVTDYTGYNQCYVEIERWSHAEHSAQLWVKVPVVSSSVDTVLYLYYDISKEDNTLLVSDSNATPAQNVWSDYYAAVWHLSQDPTHSTIDSTAYLNHSSNVSLTTINRADGVVGKALLLDGTIDRIVVLDNDSIALDDSFATISGWFYFDYIGATNIVIFHKDDHEYSVAVNSTTMRVHFNPYGTIYYTDISATTSSKTWYHFVFIWRGISNIEVYINNVLYPNGAMQVSSNRTLNNEPFEVYGSAEGLWKVQNLCLIKSGMTSDWVSAVYLSQKDDLLIYNVPSEVGWLETYESGELSIWPNRIKLEIDNTKVDEGLENFPVLVNLGDSSGHNARDVSELFTEFDYVDGSKWKDPIMAVGIGSEGTYDISGCYTNCVIKESDTSYKMWYGGYDGTNYRILYCTSIDGINWTNFQLVVNRGAEGTYDTVNSVFPSVIKESDTSYKMWYAGYDNTNYRILYCTSIDGINWTNFQLVVNFNSEGTYDTTRSMTPSVIKESDTSYKMWYAGSDNTNYRILYCTSIDGINWTNFQLVVNRGAEGTIDSTHTYMPMVIKESDTSYKMWYGGYNGTNWRTAYCTSIDGINWTNFQLTINLGLEGTYDTAHSYGVSVTKESDTSYRLWYSGNNGNWRIIHAHSALSGAYRRKIAITSADGTTQLPIEIERWDQENKSTQLWVKVPEVSLRVVTVLYVYYDINKSDNVAYVGDTGSSVAKSVWDSSFIAVYHLSQEPIVNKASMLDSTGNNYHSTPNGTLSSSNLVDAPAGKAMNFDVNGNFSQLPTSGLIPNSTSTIEYVCKYVGGGNRPWGKGLAGESVATNIVNFNWYATSFNYYYEYGGGSNGPTTYTVNTPATRTGEFHNLSFKRGSNYYTAGVDGVFSTYSTIGTTDSTAPASIGPNSLNYTDMLSMGREFRISSIVRSDSWVATTGHSNDDNLILYSNVEVYMPPEELSYFYHGYIKESASPVERKVFLYDRLLGNLVDSDISDSAGYYLLETATEEEHFIVVLDDAAGDVYDPLIQDKLLPNGK